jgi:septin family protein
LNLDNDEIRTGPCPPFTIITGSKKIKLKDSKGQEVFLFGRQYNYGFCDSLSEQNSDFFRLFVLITSILPTDIEKITDLKHKKIQKKYNE